MNQFQENVPLFMNSFIHICETKSCAYINSNNTNITNHSWKSFFSVNRIIFKSKCCSSLSFFVYYQFATHQTWTVIWFSLKFIWGPGKLTIFGSLIIVIAFLGLWYTKVLPYKSGLKKFGLFLTCTQGMAMLNSI